MSSPAAEILTPQRPFFCFVAIVVSLLPMFLYWALVAYDVPWGKDIASLIAMAVVTTILFRMLPEPWRFSRRSVGLLVIGLVVGAANFWLRYRDSLDAIQIHTTHGMWDVVVYSVLMVLVTPWWEEKSCRQVLLFGLHQFLPMWISAVVVSVLFALAHRGAMGFAFVFSLVACWLAARGVGTWDRTLLHAGINLPFLVGQLYFGLT